MTRLTTNSCFTITACALLFAIGCAHESSTNGPETSPPPATAGTDNHGGHHHSSEGPHHGGLIELGSDEYHAELVHDEEAGTVTVYVLDSSAKQQVPIDATEVTINTRHDGRPEQFSLTARPDAGDPEGKSSRFVSTEENLAHHLDEEGAEPRLVLSINGKSYRGTIAHDHDHDH